MQYCSVVERIPRCKYGFATLTHFNAINSLSMRFKSRCANSTAPFGRYKTPFCTTPRPRSAVRSKSWKIRVGRVGKTPHAFRSLYRMGNP